MTPRPKTQDPLYQAQAILSRRDHSAFELRQKLARKKFSAADIAAVLAKLERLNLINDQRFAEQYAQSVLNSKAVGPRWLAQKLKLKGVPNDTVTQVVAAAYTDGGEFSAAQRAARRWRASHPADRNRLTRFLASRGFSFDTISRVVSDDATD